MKKLLSLLTLLTVASLAMAATIESVAFHPSPSGKYDKLNVSNTLNAGTTGGTTANISRLVTNGNLDLKSESGSAGNLVVTESLTIRGTGAEVDVTGSANIKTNHASKKFTSPNTKFTAKSRLGAQKTKPVFKATNGDTANFKSPSSSATLRWLQLTDVDGKKHMVLMEDTNSSGAGCPPDGYARACCLNPAGPACTGNAQWEVDRQAAVNKSGLR
ncbi:hypothetical protein AAIR98_001246 [Elusimicrobium simillimum]|uniref:hypothetical protein n=1 Tax=Elusimicrobium simillimum TaxID=3143438 RepID=UPI003C7050CF